jgi:hypothetical protein
MESARLLRELWGRKLLLGLGLLVALLAGLSTVFRVSPSGLEHRSLEYSNARTQLLVDWSDSSLVDLDRETDPLVARAGVYARIMTSPEVLRQIGAASDVPWRRIYAKGPFELNQPRIEQEPTAERRGSQLVGEGSGYRLRFETNPTLPIVTVFAEAPTTRAATRLADGAVVGLQRYLQGLEDDAARTSSSVPPLTVAASKRVAVRRLGDAAGGTVDAGANKAVVVLATGFVFVLWCLGMLAIPRFARAWRASGAPAQPAPEAEPAPPAPQPLRPQPEPARTPTTLRPEIPTSGRARPLGSPQGGVERLR